MDAHLTLNRREPAISWSGAAGFAYCLGQALLLLVGGLVVWRRTEGVLVNSLSSSTLFVTSLLLASSCWALYLAATAWQGPTTSRTRLRLLGLTAAAIVLIAGGLNVAGTTAWGQAALWLPLVISLVGQLALVARQDVGQTTRPSADRRGLPAVEPSKRIFRVDAAHTSPVTAPHFPPQNVTQQITRSNTDDGRDQCQGWIRAAFDEGQRQQVVHLAFCPPFQTLPELSTTLADGQEVEVKHAQLMPYGARVELKRDRSAKEPSVTLLRFSAVEVRAAG